MTEQDMMEIDARRNIDRWLGTAAERREIRRRLGLTLRDVAEMTGLSVDAVARRERDSWARLRGSLESEAGKKYLYFLLRAKGIEQ